MKLSHPHFRLHWFGIFLGLVLLGPGCALDIVTKTKPTEVSIGMTPTEVMGHLGNPQAISAEGEEQIFKYRVARSRSMPILAGWRTYSFRFVDGRLVSFGPEDEIE